MHRLLPCTGGLRRRLLLAVLAGTLGFSLVAGWLAYRVGQANATAASRSTIEALADAVEKTLAVGAYANDPVLLREVVDGLARNPLVADVEVSDREGRLLARHDSAPVALHGLPGVHGSRADDSAMHIVRRLASPFNQHDPIGTLSIRADARRIAAAASREALTLAALMAAQAVLLTALIYSVASRLVTRPITGLASQLRAIEPGTTERLHTPARHRRDEIGVLIGGANALLDANAVALQRERELREEIAAMEAQYREIFESSSAGIFVLDADGRLINGNPTVSRVVGLTLEQMRSMRRDSFIQRVFAQPERVREMISQAMRRHETVSGDLELVRQGEQRRWVHCLISVQARAGQSERASAIEGVIYDVTERKSAEWVARYRSEHDGLTGLKSRIAMVAAVDRALEQARREQGCLSLLCADLDGFKAINDLHGHEAGDRVLAVCGERMRGAVRRASDLIGRMGGDEFVVLLPGLDSRDAAVGDTARALLRALLQPIVLANGAEVTVGASIGIACAPRHGRRRPELLRAADEAMYAVKRAGKDGFAMALGAPAPAPSSDATPMAADAVPTMPSPLDAAPETIDGA